MIAEDYDSCFLPHGVNVPSLDRNREWEFCPLGFKVDTLALAHPHFLVGRGSYYWRRCVWQSN